MQHLVPSFATAIVLSAGLAALPAYAAVIPYSAQLTAAAETPPTESTGTGSFQGTYDTDTKVLTWTLTYEGLSGPVTAAHFHGPAKAGLKADPVLPIDPPYDSPIKGTSTLTDAQYKDLKRGAWYVNLHTDKYPDGELRGQIAYMTH